MCRRLRLIEVLVGSLVIEGLGLLEVVVVQSISASPKMVVSWRLRKVLYFPECILALFVGLEWTP